MSLDLLRPKERLVYAADLGFSAAPTNASITGNEISTFGYNCLTLYCEFTRSAATGTVQLTVEAKSPITTNWCKVQTNAISAGTVTFSDGSFEKATGSASQSYEIRLTALTFDGLRVKMPSAITNATASDVLTITGILSYQP